VFGFAVLTLKQQVWMKRLAVLP